MREHRSLRAGSRCRLGQVGDGRFRYRLSSEEGRSPRSPRPDGGGVETGGRRADVANGRRHHPERRHFSYSDRRTSRYSDHRSASLPAPTPAERRVLDCWADILRVNYWPISHIATRLLLPIPDAIANRVSELASAADDLAGIGVTTMHDLAGRMFQQLIADRKFLATFYTLPPSAAMIADLAVARLDARWGDDSSVTGLRVADLACGTGTLQWCSEPSVHGGKSTRPP